MATEEVTTLPEYVDYGVRATAPGAFECLDGHFRGIRLEADPDQLEKLTDKMFNAHAGDGPRYRVLTKDVLMLFGWFGSVRATTPPFDEWGTVHEAQTSLWVPLAQGREENGRFVADRIVMAVPFIFVDNPMSYAGGRETYGYPKSLGSFQFEDDDVDGTMSVDTFGGPFGRDNQAGWRRIITVSPKERSLEGEEGDAVELEGNEAFVKHLTEGRLDPNQESLLPNGIRLLTDAIEQALKGESRQLFLKQFRDATEPKGACYQEIIEADIHLTRTKAKFWPRAWQVKIDDFSSHPICEEMGLKKSQTTRWTYAMDMEFVCERGTRVT